MLDREISNYVDILQGVAQGCTQPPSLFKVYINDTIVAVEAAKQGVTVGEDAASGLVLADGFVAIFETREGLQSKSRRHCSRIYSEMGSDSETKTKCEVVVCSKDKENPEAFRWNWRKD